MSTMTRITVRELMATLRTFHPDMYVVVPRQRGFVVDPEWDEYDGPCDIRAMPMACFGIDVAVPPQQAVAVDPTIVVVISPVELDYLEESEQ